MKTLGVIIVILALIIGCAGCSCTTAREEEKKTDGIGSPWEYDVSAKDVEKLVGKEFVVPSNATDVHYGIMKDEKMAEMSFTIDGVQYVHRMKIDKGYEDISGLG